MQTFQDLLEELSPYFFSNIGVYTVLGMSIMGSAIGIMNTGSSLVSATVHHPEIKSKNLLSVLFCEAIALYGVIMSIILFSTVQSGSEKYVSSTVFTNVFETFRGGFGVCAAGVAVGIANFAAAITVGVLGSAVCIAHTNDSTLFVKLFISEIFAEAVALIGLISGIVISTTIKFLQA